MSNLSYYNNSLIEEDRSFGSLKYSVTLAEKLGLSNGHNDKDISGEQRNRVKLLQSIDLMKSISLKKEKANNNDLLLQRLQLHTKTLDLIGKSAMEDNLKKFKTLSEHLQQLIEQKGQLISRLQQPFIRDYLAIHSDFHEYVCKLFPQLIQTLSTLNTQLDNIEWISNLEFNDEIFENLLLDISSSLAGLQTNFQIILQMRQLIQDKF